MTPDERLGFDPIEVVELFLVDALDEWNVLEAFGGEEAHAGAFTLDHGIGGHRRSQDRGLEPIAAFPEIREHGFERVTGRSGRRWAFGLVEPSVLVDRDQVRERAADIDPDPSHHLQHRRVLVLDRTVGPCPHRENAMMTEANPN